MQRSNIMTNSQVKYKEEMLPILKEEFGFKNDLSVPTLVKVVVNASSVDAITNKEILEKIKEQLATITGQAAKVTKARESISAFKLKEKDPIGVMVTLRNKKAWNFIERLVATVLPRIRDFRGLSQEKFDKFGNYSFGLTEQILFPEIDYSKIDKVRGMVITLVIRNSDPEKSKRFMELLGFPFRKD